MGVNFIKIYQILVISKSWKKSDYSLKKLNICDKSEKFEVENFEHLRSSTVLELIKNNKAQKN